jgi:hypothetical protein
VVEATYQRRGSGVLALAGVRRSDRSRRGGATTARFDDLRRRTLLANGHPGFDLQFRGIARTILRPASTLPWPCRRRHSAHPQASVLINLVTRTARQRQAVARLAGCRSCRGMDAMAASAGPGRRRRSAARAAWYSAICRLMGAAAGDAGPADAVPTGRFDPRSPRRTRRGFGASGLRSGGARLTRDGRRPWKRWIA